MLLASNVSLAAKVAEFSFQVNEDASFVQVPLTGNFNLAGASTPPGAVTNSGTAVGIGVQTHARTGYLDLTDSNDGAQSTETYSQYFGTGPLPPGAGANNLATMTYVGVFKPGYSGVQGARRWFFNNGSNGTPPSLSFLSSGDSGGRLAVAGGRATENDWALTTANPISWDSNTWYMVAFSMQPSSAADPGAPTSTNNNGLPDAKVRMYLRDLKVNGVMTPGSTPITATSDSLRIWNTRMIPIPVINPFPFGPGSLNIAFGNRNDGNTIGNEGADQDFALIQLYNNFSEFSDFDLIFNQIIPEPSSAAMLLIGSVLVGMRRVRRSRQKFGH
jgi:hypothetical protein